MADEYNPDTFDWGGDEDYLDLDAIGPDVVEMAVKAALDAHEEIYGWRYIKRSERKENGGRAFRVKYYMPKEKRDWCEENWPGYTFIWDGALGHHDHPVAHLCTELNEIEMVSEMVSSGEVFIDLFGNGKRDAKYKRKCINLYTKATGKDYLRYQNPGAQDVLFDMDKLCDAQTYLGKINRITSTHALYYQSMEDIGRIVNTSSKRKYTALIHRHGSTHGYLNMDEQEYWVSESGTVVQTNVATGEKYCHPSMEALFHQQTAVTKSGGVAWTIRAGGGDSFMIDFVGCPNEICEEYVPLRFLKPESWEVYCYNNISVTKFLHWTWMTAKTSAGKVSIEDVDLFSKLRRYVAGKPRSPRLKTETMNYARRLCNKADIISIHGGGAHEIPVASMSDYVEVSFYVDVKSELDAAISFHRENAQMVQALNVYYESGTTPTDFTLITGAAVKSGKYFSDAAITIIDQVREMRCSDPDRWVEDRLKGTDLAKLKKRPPAKALRPPVWNW